MSATKYFTAGKMPLSLKVTGSQKDSLVISLAAVLLHDLSVDISSENLNTVLEAAKLTVPSYYAPLYSSYITKAGGVEKFFAGPSAGGGGSAPSSSAAPAAGNHYGFIN